MRKIDADAFYARVAPECKFPELLKAQLDAEHTVEERLQKPMTLEEACGSEEPCVFLEMITPKPNYTEIRAVDVCLAAEPNGIFDCDVYEIRRNEPGFLASSFYGWTWRCWASKPTYEERMAAAWKGSVMDNIELIQYLRYAVGTIKSLPYDAGKVDDYMRCINAIELAIDIIKQKRVDAV